MIKMNQKGIGTIFVLFLILVIGVVGFAGWRIWSSQNHTISDSNNNAENNVQHITGSAPVENYNESDYDAFCTTPVEQNGDHYEIFSDKSDTYTFKNEKAGIEFSYPKQWGAVQVDGQNLPVCVGPMLLDISISAKNSQGNEDDLSVSKNSYYKQNGKYYSNWLKNSETGPIEIKKENYDVFAEVPTADSEIKGLLLLNKRCYGLGCSREVIINLSAKPYDGLLIRNERITSIEAEESAQGDTSNQELITSGATYEDKVNELRTFAKTVKVSQ